VGLDRTDVLIRSVYHHHQHSETKQTPLERYTAALDHVRPADPETLRLAFLWREKRKVRRNATISLQSNVYQVDPALAGRTLTLHYDPFDLSHVELYLADRHLGTATVTVQKRQRHLQVERLVTDPPQPDPQPSSSLDFLAALREEYRVQRQQELGQLHFSHLTDGDASSLDEDDPDVSSEQLAPEEA
jgi:putative transposase